MSVSNADTFLMSVRIGSAEPSAAGDSGSASGRDACFKRNNGKSSAQKPLSTQLSAVVVEHDGTGRSAVHNLGQASVGIGKFVDQGSRVLALYTGGTMGMKPDRNGRLAPVKGYLTQQIKELLKQHEEEPLPRVEVQEWDELLDSCDVGPDQWRKVALDIQQRYEEVEGFVVIMGTDTMAYTASALSFMLENLGKTVIITGSQVPFGRINSDARRNLLFAFALACTLDIPEVCIVFDRVLLRGVRSRKEDSGSFAAFCSPFISPLATLGLSVQVNTSLILPQPKGAFRVQDNMQTRVIVLKIVPSFDMLALHRLGDLGAAEAKAVVIELISTEILGDLGAGEAKAVVIELLVPRSTLTSTHVASSLQNAKKKGLLIVMTSPNPLPARWGESRSGGGGRTGGLAEEDVVDALDMTTEACCAKLAYLFGKGLSSAQVAVLMVSNLRGELSGPYVGDDRSIAAILNDRLNATHRTRNFAKL